MWRNFAATNACQAETKQNTACFFEGSSLCPPGFSLWTKFKHRFAKQQPREKKYNQRWNSCIIQFKRSGVTDYEVHSVPLSLKISGRITVQRHFTACVSRRMYQPSKALCSSFSLFLVLAVAFGSAKNLTLTKIVQKFYTPASFITPEISDFWE